MKAGKWLILIFSLSLLIRLIFAFSTPNFSDSTSYFHMRQVESILETGLPIYEDLLSYSGRFYIVLPFFHYLISFFAIFMPVKTAMVIVSGVLMSSVVFTAYLTAKKITGDTGSALVASLLAGFIPMTFQTVNQVSKSDLVLPMLFLLLYLFMNISEKNVYLFLAGLLVLTLTDTAVLVFLFSLLIYIFLLWIHRVE